MIRPKKFVCILFVDSFDIRFDVSPNSHCTPNAIAFIERHRASRSLWWPPNTNMYISVLEYQNRIEKKEKKEEEDRTERDQFLLIH